MEWALSAIERLLDRIAGWHATVSWGMMGQAKETTKPSGRIIMGHNHARIARWPVLAAAAAFVFATASANAEPRVVRIATQYGISYLPLTIMAEKKMLEAEGKKLGLDLGTDWTVSYTH